MQLYFLLLYRREAETYVHDMSSGILLMLVTSCGARVCVGATERWSRGNEFPPIHLPDSVMSTV